MNMDVKNKDRLIPLEVCPRCGNTFECSKGGKCWCFGVHLSPAALDYIQQNYSSCLCPKCLDEIAGQGGEKD